MNGGLILHVAVGGTYRHAGEVQHVQHVAVAELVRQREGEEVVIPYRALGLQRVERHARAAHGLLHVRPRRINALGHAVLALVEQVVDNGEREVAHPDLVRVRERNRERHVAAGVVLHHRVQLAARVAGGLADLRQYLFQLLSHEFGGYHVRHNLCLGHAWYALSAHREYTTALGAGQALRSRVCVRLFNEILYVNTGGVIMLDEATQQRFDQIRDRLRQGPLSESEQAELDGIVRQIEEAEAVYLRPANERMRAETKQLEEQNRVLLDIVRRKKRLANNLERYLESVRAKQDALNVEST